MEKSDIGVDSTFISEGYINKRQRRSTELLCREKSARSENESKSERGKEAQVLPRVTSSSSLPERGEACRKDESRHSACRSHGSVSLIGRRRAMEDAIAVVPMFLSYDFFAVYDGHGGPEVARACRDRMHELLTEELEGSARGGPVDWERVMTACFVKMDEEVRSVAGGENGFSASVKTTGSTALVVVTGADQVVVANCGDSRAVMSRGGVAVPLSFDHKPDRPDERKRVEAAGGRILDWNGSRVLGVLAISRSIGDYYLKPYVTPKPEVTVNERSELDDFLIIASDGLWDVISNELACEVATKCFDRKIKRRTPEGSGGGSHAAEVAAILAELAIARGSKDNISVVVVKL